MSPIDVANVQFDYDLVFAVMFLNGHGHVYGRYGGRSPWNSESRVSMPGLKYTMREILGVHDAQQHPDQPLKKPLLARNLPGGRRSCMHCHEVWEGIRRVEKEQGRFNPRSLFVYPRPENLGVSLDVTQGNVVLSVSKDSPSDRAGIRAGAKIEKLSSTPVYSQADVSWALHNAPRTGSIDVQFRQAGKTTRARLLLPAYWRETKLSWRASMRKEAAPTRLRK